MNLQLNKAYSLQRKQEVKDTIQGLLRSMRIFFIAFEYSSLSLPLNMPTRILRKKLPEIRLYNF